jgi:signal transduction histidine kinase
MPLTSSLPLRVTLGAAAALVVALAILMSLIGAAANRTLSERTLDTLDAELSEARAVFGSDGLDAMARHLDRRSAAGGATRYGLALEAAPPRGALSTATVASTADRMVFTYADVRTGQIHLAVGRRALIPLPDGRTATLLLAHDIDDQRQLARTLQLIALAGTAVIALSAMTFGLYARRRLLARVETVSRTSRAIMAGDLAQRIPRDGSGDEIDQMAETLNSMLVRIDDLMQALRDVSDNIAHDLRTPLNRLRLIAEDALRTEQKAPATGEALGRIIEEADSLIKTFNAMLLIARLEQGVGADVFEPVDVAQLVEDTAELYQPVAEDADLIVLVETDEPSTTLPANRQLLGQAIANLIDNAIKYTPQNRQRTPADVIIRVHAAQGAINISVADSGPGIAPEDRERALKRFVRLEKSRSLPGTGLGLSLVAAVVRLHGGTLQLEDNAPGLRATVSLPRTRSP